MLALVAAALVAQGGPFAEPPPRPARLSWTPKIDLPVTAALGGGWLLSEFVFKSKLAPATCRWCEPTTLDENVRAIFLPRVGPDGASPADAASNVLWAVGAAGSLTIDLALAWHDGALNDFPIDAVLIFEATFAAMALDQTVKFAAGRERPFVHHLAPADRPSLANADDGNLSFFSGHATFTMAFAVAAGTVAKLRGYRLGWVAFAFGIPLSLTVGILRMAADKHYFTDVLAGWAVGAGIGFGVPWLFHQPELPFTLQLVPAPGGVAVAGRF